MRALLGPAAAYAHAILRSRHDAEDAIQQAMLRAWQRIHTYDSSRPFKGWWFSILRNCCLDVIRTRRVARTENVESLEAIDSGSMDVDDWVGLNRALAMLTEAHREILRMKYFGDLSYEEIATALGIPRGTVMSRLHLARKALAAIMQEKNT